MKIEAVNTIKYNGNYYMPGSIFDIEEGEAKRLIDLGVATDRLDPEMQKAAVKKIDQLVTEKEKIQQDLDQAIKNNAAKQKKIDELTAKLESAKSARTKKAIKNKIDTLSSSIKKAGDLENQLNAKEDEIKNLSG